MVAHFGAYSHPQMMRSMKQYNCLEKALQVWKEFESLNQKFQCYRLKCHHIKINL